MSQGIIKHETGLRPKDVSLASNGRNFDVRNNNSPSTDRWLDRLTVLFGLLIPIYAISDIVPPIFLSSARALLAGLLILRVLPISRQDQRYIHPAWYLLGYGVLVASIANLDTDALSYLLTTIPAVLLGYGLALRGRLQAMLLGYRIGIILSAVAALLASWGVVDLTPVDLPYGNEGLSYRGPALASELAVGLAIWFFAYRNARGARSILLTAEGLTLLSALLVSGGRTGFVAVVLVLLAQLLVGHRRRALVVVVAGLVAFGIWTAMNGPPPTALRLLGMTETAYGATNVDYTAGRYDIYKDTVERITADPVFGSGFSSTVGAESPTMGFSPHNAILALMFYGGILPAVAAAAILASALTIVFRGRHKAPEDQLPASIVIVFLCQSTVELGAFFGATTIVIFCAALCAASLPVEQKQVARWTSPTSK